MIKGCEGCKYEFQEALDLQEQGYYFATSLDREYNGRKHFAVWMVDDNGKYITW